MLAKAAGTGADELVIDLEDSVAVAEKEAARIALPAAVERLELAGPALTVRVNAPRSPWCHRDLAAVAEIGGVDSVIVPKVESAADIAFVERLLDGVERAAGRERPLRVQALIETAAGLLHAEEIATASARVQGLILGYADLAASLGRPQRGDLESWRGAQEQLLLAARASLVEAIDGPFFELEDSGGLDRACARAAALGFDGKWAIHPGQVAAVNAAFTPTPDQVERARAVLAALGAAAVEDGAGAVRLDGEMVDEAMAVGARRILARAGLGEPE